MKKTFILLLSIMMVITLTACGNKKAKNNENTNNYNNPEQNQNNKEENNNNVIDDEIIEFDDEDNKPYEEEIIKVDKIINCDGCVFSYFSEAKKIGSTLSEEEYTEDIKNLKTMGDKQRHNFFGFVLSGNTISKAYSCIYKDNKIYCIQGSTDGSYFTNNIGILNQIFASDKCKYLSNGHTYWCADGDYSGDTNTSGYTSLHYETSCTIYGADARTGELICH